ncbi:MAG: butyrate kinase [Candidatus Cloacimonetes bacterium]|nr:butyrate kinase [Candidatus Cloacimonadota bacterium]
MRVLVINPGSTSTKIAVFESEKEIYLKNIKHSSEKISKYDKITDQYKFRKDTILEELKKAEFTLDTIDCIVARGGLVKPIPSGIYLVNEKMKKDLREGVIGEHASNLGGLIADDIAKSLQGVNAYIVDPVVVDEMQDVARISGHPKFERLSIFHALNQKAIARIHTKSVGKSYEDLNLIVVHMGGGISVGAHRKGKVVDVNQALDGEGPFSPERSGTLPSRALAEFCFSGEYTLAQVKKMITGQGGFVAYFGTNDAREIELRVKKDDKKAKLIQDAMSYQIAKEIAAASAVLKGQVDAILLTGGLANNTLVVDYIKDMVSFIAPIKVYPGEDEMKAMAMNGFMVLRGEVKASEY